MAYDGLFIKNQINEFKKIILNESISKIYSVNKKEIDIIFRIDNKNINLSISVNPSSPIMYIKKSIDNNDKTPTGFTMLLRKYLKSGKIINISQIRDKNEYSLERIVDIEVLNINEQGDYATYHLIIELMGKFSNIIITDDKYIIIDILNKPTNITENKRILSPKTLYTTDEIINKIDIFDNDYKLKNIDEIISFISNKLIELKNNKKDYNLLDLIINSISGISKTYIEYKFNELNMNKYNYDAYKSIYDEDIINKDKLEILIKDIYKDIIDIENKTHKSYIFKSKDKYKDFHIFDFSLYNEDYEKIEYNDSSTCVIDYFNSKINDSQTSNDKKNLMNFATNLRNKLLKKNDLYNKEIEDAKDLEKYKIYGELVNTYGYDKKNIKDNKLICINHYDNKEVSIPLDMSKSISDNANIYFNKYNKLKRTIDSANELLEKNDFDLTHINEIIDSFEFINDDKDLFLIKKELNEYFKYSDKKLDKNINNAKSKSYKNKLNYNIDHYKSSSGIDIYVGKNNLQNEYLTFTIASPNDTWLHVKNRTGSHVIIKKSYEELDMKTIEEAASLAAYFSTMKNETKVTVDYTFKKELKKVKGKQPGFVIYNKNFSINVEPGVFIKKL